jgi:subtilisin family serine protease
MLRPMVLLIPILAIECVRATEKPIESKQLVVAVIDTGIGYPFKDSAMLCKSGHKNFVVPECVPDVPGLIGPTPYEACQQRLKVYNDDPFPYDRHGHGTHISGLIDQYAKGISLNAIRELAQPMGEAKGMAFLDAGYKQVVETKANYCQIILKFYDDLSSGHENMKHTLEALQYAIDMKVDFINYSGGGGEFNAKEKKLLQQALKAGITLVVAAGNEMTEIVSATSLEQWAHVNRPQGTYFPASYAFKKMYVVGNTDSKTGERALSSNYGSIVNSWEIGTSALSFGLNGATANGYGQFQYMTGTSQSTAIKTGKLIRDRLIK